MQCGPICTVVHVPLVTVFIMYFQYTISPSSPFFPFFSLFFFWGGGGPNVASRIWKIAMHVTMSNLLNDHVTISKFRYSHMFHVSTYLISNPWSHVTKALKGNCHRVNGLSLMSPDAKEKPVKLRLSNVEFVLIYKFYKFFRFKKNYFQWCNYLELLSIKC